MIPLTGANRSPESVDSALDELRALAQERGLQSDSIEEGYELALTGNLSTPQALALLPALIPREPLGIRPVLLILANIGRSSTENLPSRGGQNATIQRKALDQLAIMMELGAVGSDGKDVLARLFTAGETGLGSGNLRDPTAALLCEVARRHHVQAFRIKSIQDVVQQAVNPSLSVLRLRAVYASFQPEHVYRQHTLRGKNDRGMALEDWRELVSSSTPPLSDMTSLSEVARNIASLSLPSQAASLLADVPGSSRPVGGVLPEQSRCKTWAALLKCGSEAEDDLVTRLAAWVTSHVQQDLQYDANSVPRSAQLADLLCRVREFGEMGGELMADLQPLLAELLQAADDDDPRLLFDLITLLKPLDYADLRALFLDRLSTFVAAAQPERVVGVLDCLTELISNLATWDGWASTSANDAAFGRVDSPGLYLESLQGILASSDAIIGTTFRHHPTSLVIRAATLSFYEAALDLPLLHNLPIVQLPSSAFIYGCLTSSDLMSISRMCGILTKLRNALTGDQSAVPKEDPATTDLITSLNAHLVDVVNALWQKKFATPQVDHEALDLPADDLAALQELSRRRGQSVGTSQSLTMHSALATLARECFIASSEIAGKSVRLDGPVTPLSVKQLNKDPGALQTSFNDFRPAFLEHLLAEGADGIHTFLFSSLQSLINRRMSASAVGVEMA
ncbi:hypothetical protein JCM10207_005635 [Rhodosporidiobolus poonsookiae]